jgi:very-short-patch-repair endonuclease/predicted transcriptional regulator of viral defense system
VRAREHAIGEIAARQDNVITSDQLAALALGRGAIAHRLAIGRWQRLHNGVYLIGSAPATAMARARAAIYACGEGAVLSHHTAAALHDLIPADEAAEVHVTVAGRNPGTRDGLIVHRVAELPRHERAIRHGLPVTSPARTVCDIAATAGPREIERILAEGRFRGVVRDRDLLRAVDRVPTRRGSSVLRALLQAEAESGYTRSEAERRMLKLTRAAGLPRPMLNEPLLGYVVDFLWPTERLVVEVDGFGAHGRRQSFESDRRRDQQLVAAGYRVVRVTWIQLRDEPIAVITSIAQALAIASRATA